MKSVWLEKLAADGQIRQSVKEAIYQDCAGLVLDRAQLPKTASEFRAVLNAMPLEKLAVSLADVVITTGATLGLEKGGSAKTPGTIRDVAHKILPFASLGIAGGLGLGLVRHGVAQIDKKELEKKLKKSFEEALRMGPSDQDPLHQDIGKARQAFQTLVHFAPHVACDPSAARAFMNKLVSYDQGILTSDVKDLTEIERNLHQAKGDSTPFMSGFSSGSEAFGLKSGVGAAYKTGLGLQGSGD